MAKAYQTILRKRKLRRILHFSRLSQSLERMKYDVFVSFRGIDTRSSFVSHLCHSLFKRRIRFFKNEEDIPEDEPAPSQVLQSIKESRAAIVVISKNFSSSVSCLDELAKIIECREKSSQGSTTSLFLVVPVFYYIDPSDVLRQADNLGGGDNLEKVEKWRDALTKFTRTFDHFFDWEQDDSDIIDKATNYISEHLFARRSPSNQESKSLSTSGTESNEISESASLRLGITGIDEFIESESLRIRRTESNELSESERLRIPRNESNELSLTELTTLAVQDLKTALGTMAGRYIYREKFISVKPRLRSSVNVTGNKLALTSSSDFDNLVGMDRHLKAVDALLLGLDSKDGVGEIGIWGVRGVGKTTLVRCVYQQISRQFQDHCYVKNDTSKSSLGRDATCLLEEITRAALKTTSQSVTRNSDLVKAKLGHRKVLLIVDGVDHISQLKDITLIASWFGPRSRLIIVTQDKSLLLQSRIRHLYEVESLNYDEALQLFSQFAFKETHIPRGFDRLCARAVFITGHIPLALKVFGSFLCGKNIKEWEFELLRLEASQDNWTSVVSSYIGGDFYRRHPTKLDRYIGGEDDDGEEFPSYCFALG